MGQGMSILFSSRSLRFFAKQAEREEGLYNRYCAREGGFSLAMVFGTKSDT